MAEIKQDSFQYQCFDIQGAAYFQKSGLLFIESPGRNLESSNLVSMLKPSIEEHFEIDYSLIKAKF